MSAIKSNLTIRITQNIDYTLICEADTKMQVLKDVKFTKPESNIEIDWVGFCAVTKTVNFPYKVPQFIPNCNQSYYADSVNFCGGYCTGIMFYIYYTKNFNLLKKFYKFLLGKESFDFAGKKYKLSVPASGYAMGYDKDEKMGQLIEELETYIAKLPAYFDKAGTQNSVDAWISNNKNMLDEVTVNVPAINIHFESKNMSNDHLSDFSRIFMDSLITEYYHERQDNIGNKISIYQLHIKYDVEIKKKENPEYAKWQLKYGKKEKSAEKNADKDKEKSPTDEDKNKSKEKEPNSDDSKGSVKKSPNASKNTKGDMMCSDGPYSDYEFSFGPRHYMGGYNYMPMKPSKFIEEEIYTPMAESKHIKSDKKPMQYLYLQKSDKQLLQSYLSNFKNNRELYDKMGICYKGGIILSGTPGCGKSSTIMAIATYLNKDIYYLDLGKLKTNNELQLCVDYVKTNSQRGGVIIFEDIDCMTDIVKKRETNNLNTTGDNSEPNKKATSGNDELSLSFLLNILDGTMAPENIIFVMTTNHRELLDPALIRPGRMDISINIDKCDKYQLQQIYYDLFGKFPQKENIDRFQEYKYITAEVIMHLFHNIYNNDITEEELLMKFFN